MTGNRLGFRGKEQGIEQGWIQRIAGDAGVTRNKEQPDTMLHSDTLHGLLSEIEIL